MRPPLKRTRSFFSVSTLLSITLCIVSYYLGSLRLSGFIPPLPSRLLSLTQPRPSAKSALADPCTLPPDFRSLHLQEFLDVPTTVFSHPLLPDHAPPPKVYVTKRPGASYGPHTEFWDTASEGTWEPTTFKVLRAVLEAGALKKKDTHWDIGGWVGPTTLFAAHFARRVLTLEPDPRAFAEINGNVLLNPTLSPRVHLYRHCLAAVSGPVTMTGPAPMGSSMSRVEGAAKIPQSASKEPNWGERMVSWPATCSTPADFAAFAGISSNKLALIKVDVEGAEANFFPLLVQWLQAQGGVKPPVFMELHVDFFATAGSDVVGKLAKAMGSYLLAFASEPERPGRIVEGNVLLPYYPESLLGETGAICPGKEPFCMVLLVDEESEWVKDLVKSTGG